MPRLALLLILVLSSLVVARPAAAHHCAIEENEFGGVTGGLVSCHGEDAGGDSSSDVSYDPDDLVTAISEVDGQPCTILATTTSNQGEAAIIFENALQTLPVFGQPLHNVYQWIINGLPGCPNTNPPPQAVAWSFVRTATPPTSDPHIAPGWAITGKKAYLQTRGPTTTTQTFDTILGPLTITFTATHLTIDWGDQTNLDTGPYTLPTNPYPNGQAAHTYTHHATYTITTRTHWQATWTVAGETGTLDGLTRTERINNFQARQLQAVRNH